MALQVDEPARQDAEETDAKPSVPVALCADDYAIAPGVDEGTLSLARAGRITAVSCMTASPRWPETAAALKPFFWQLDIGLHFTLTQLAPLGPMPKLARGGKLPAARKLYRLAALGWLRPAEIAAELERQIDAFGRELGRLPDFLDGHHHVHQLRGVCAVVARIWPGRSPSGWIRNTATSLAHLRARGVAKSRAALLSFAGRRARRTWEAAEIPTNSDFAGVRNFTDAEQFRTLMQSYLRGAEPGLLIMCHPGTPDQELADIDWVTSPRGDELAYLSSDDFPDDLKAAGCHLARLSSVLAQRRSSAAG